MTTRGVALVVEDNERNQRLLRAVLESDQWEVHIVPNGEAALGSLDDVRPAVVLLDIGLPHMDGFEVLTRLRATARGSRIPVIAVTSHAMADDIARMETAGFTAIVTKPFVIGELLALMREYTAERSASR